MIRKALFIATSLITANALAAIVTVDKPISVMGINGTQYEESTIELGAGTHQIVARYSFQLPDKGNKKKRIQSEVKVFTVTIDEQESIDLLAPRFNRYAQAEFAFNNDKIDWSFVDQDGNRLSYEVEHIPGRPGFLPYGDIERVIEDYNTKNNIIVDREKGIVTGEVASNETASVVAEAGSTTPGSLSQLQTQFLQLSREEQKEFRKWLIDIE